jgi:hypothetical protein
MRALARESNACGKMSTEAPQLRLVCTRLARQQSIAITFPPMEALLTTGRRFLLKIFIIWPPHHVSITS